FLRLDAGEHRQRDFRTDPADPDQPLEQLLLEQRREAVEQERILAHVRVDAQRDRRARLAEPVEGRQRDEHVIADAVDVNHDAVRMFFEDAAAKMRDHDRAGLPRRSATGSTAGRYVRQLVARLRAGCTAPMARDGGWACTWQIAIASA